MAGSVLLPRVSVSSAVNGATITLNCQDDPMREGRQESTLQFGTLLGLASSFLHIPPACNLLHLLILKAEPLLSTPHANLQAAFGGSFLCKIALLSF